MATDERTAWEKRTRTELEPDVGAVDTDDPCEQSDHCDREQQYRVPWPNFGGDVALEATAHRRPLDAVGQAPGEFGLAGRRHLARRRPRLESERGAHHRGRRCLSVSVGRRSAARAARGVRSVSDQLRLFGNPLFDC